jgi:hypothetical protein
MNFDLTTQAGRNAAVKTFDKWGCVLEAGLADTVIWCQG